VTLPYLPAAHSKHTDPPLGLYLPTPHSAAAGVAVVDPARQAYPALQLVHDVAPEKLNWPGGQMSEAGVDDTAPGEHA
jgi:hypothetical protein